MGVPAPEESGRERGGETRVPEWDRLRLFEAEVGLASSGEVVASRRPLWMVVRRVRKDAAG